MLLYFVLLFSISTQIISSTFQFVPSSSNASPSSNSLTSSPNRSISHILSGKSFSKKGHLQIGPKSGELRIGPKSGELGTLPESSAFRERPQHQRRNTWAFTQHLSFSKKPSKRNHLQSVPNSGELRALPESSKSPIRWPFSPSSHSSPSTRHQRRYSMPTSPLYPSGTKSGELGMGKLRGPKPLPISLANNETKKVASPNCNCGWWKWLRMKDFIFHSDISKKELKVKVAIHEGNFAGGKWAKVFNGCFKPKESKEWQCVGVKLVGRGTIQSPKESVNLMKDEEIFDDPKKEINNLQTIIKETFTKPDQRKHIIKLYDGGKISYPNEKDRKKYEYEYQYAVILELGENTYLEEFINQSKTLKTEKEIMQFAAKGVEPFIEIHKILIHMDLKPQNMVYVKEKSGEKILKVIDFSGAQFFQQNQSNDPSSSKSGKGHHREGIQMKYKKLTSTFYLMPPEIDGRYHYYLHYKQNEDIENEDIVKANFNPIATTKSDMWEFGILIYNLLLVHEYPEKSQKEISNYLDAINKIYQFGNGVKHFEDIHKFVQNVFPFIKKDEIFGYAQILKIRSKYPRLFLLVTNLLDKNPWERLSAKGVFDYLNGECKMVGNEEEWYAMKDKYIGQITIEMVKESNLEEMASKQEIKLEFSNDNMEKMFKEDWSELKKITKICDRGELIQSDSPEKILSNDNDGNDNEGNELKKITTIFDRDELIPPDSPEQILSSDNDGNDNENRQEMHKFKMEHWWNVSDPTVTAVNLKQQRRKEIILRKE